MSRAKWQFTALLLLYTSSVFPYIGFRYTQNNHRQRNRLSHDPEYAFLSIERDRLTMQELEDIRNAQACARRWECAICLLVVLSMPLCVLCSYLR